jgi:peptidoglycan hydrolase-like protein with peptidoglycan-binding domain
MKQMKQLISVFKKYLNIRIAFFGIIISLIAIPTVAFASVGYYWTNLSWVGPGYETAGVNVKAAQQICTDAGYGSVIKGIDGYYGTNTGNGIRDFQSSHGLSADGVVGSQTWNVMQSGLQYGYTFYYQNGNEKFYEWPGGSAVFGYNSVTGDWAYTTGDVDGAPLVTTLNYN